jgi:hypothetical protein
MFACILADTAETETGVNPGLAKAKQTIKELRSGLGAVEHGIYRFDS